MDNSEFDRRIAEIDRRDATGDTAGAKDLVTLLGEALRAELKSLRREMGLEVKQ
jgi:hypothetical protein